MNVKDINVGDHVGIGYYMDSCLDCNFCKTDEEPLCDKGTVIEKMYIDCLKKLHYKNVRA